LRGGDLDGFGLWQVVKKKGFHFGWHGLLATQLAWDEIAKVRQKWSDI
jgi:hypothetical protein